SHEDWNLLTKLTDDVEDEEYENQLLRVFFQTKAAETGKSNKVPEWIIDNVPKGTIEPLPQILPTVNEAVDLILDDLHKHRINIAGDDVNIKETLISQYAISTMTEKIIMLQSVKSIPIIDDTSIFREFGPV